MSKMEIEAPKHQPVSTASLLIVDDNSMNRIMLSRYTTRLGYQSTLVENGRQALEKLQNESFDLVLLDVLMNWGSLPRSFRRWHTRSTSANSACNNRCSNYASRLTKRGAPGRSPTLPTVNTFSSCLVKQMNYVTE